MTPALSVDSGNWIHHLINCNQFNLTVSVSHKTYSVVSSGCKAVIDDTYKLCPKKTHKFLRCVNCLSSKYVELEYTLYLQGILLNCYGCVANWKPLIKVSYFLRVHKTNIIIFKCIIHHYLVEDRKHFFVHQSLLPD